MSCGCCCTYTWLLSSGVGTGPSFPQGEAVPEEINVGYPYHFWPSHRSSPYSVPLFWVGTTLCLTSCHWAAWGLSSIKEKAGWAVGPLQVAENVEGCAAQPAAALVGNWSAVATGTLLHCCMFYHILTTSHPSFRCSGFHLLRVIPTLFSQS